MQKRMAVSNIRAVTQKKTDKFKALVYPPGKLSLQTHNFYGQLEKECFQLLLERKYTTNCLWTILQVIK